MPLLLHLYHIYHTVEKTHLVLEWNLKSQPFLIHAPASHSLLQSEVKVCTNTNIVLSLTWTGIWKIAISSFYWCNIWLHDCWDIVRSSTLHKLHHTFQKTEVVIWRKWRSLRSHYVSSRYKLRLYLFFGLFIQYKTLFSVCLILPNVYEAWCEAPQCRLQLPKTNSQTWRVNKSKGLPQMRNGMEPVSLFIRRVVAARREKILF